MEWLDADAPPTLSTERDRRIAWMLLVTSLALPAGQRYANQRENGVRILLAVRAAKKDE